MFFGISCLIISRLTLKFYPFKEVNEYLKKNFILKLIYLNNHFLNGKFICFKIVFYFFGLFIWYVF